MASEILVPSGQEYKRVPEELKLSLANGKRRLLNRLGALVECGLISLQHLTSLPPTALVEIAERFDLGGRFCNFSPRKFRSVSGQADVDQRLFPDRTKFDHLMAKSYRELRLIYDSDDIVAIVVGGSFSRSWATPCRADPSDPEDKGSDLDLDIIVKDGTKIDYFTLDHILHAMTDLPTFTNVRSLTPYKEDLKRILTYNACFASPFRNTNDLAPCMSGMVLAIGDSLVVGDVEDANFADIDSLVHGLPDRFSQIPYGFDRPDCQTWESMQNFEFTTAGVVTQLASHLHNNVAFAHWNKNN